MPPRAALALAVTLVVWASAFPVIRVGVEGLGVAGLSLARLGVASAALALVAPLLGVRRPQRRDAASILLCGAAGMSAYQLCSTGARCTSPPGPRASSWRPPRCSGVLLAAGFLGERLTPRIVAGSAVALAGVALIAVAEGGAGVSASAIAVLAAAAVQGTYHFASKPLLARYRGLEVACYAMWSGTLLLTPLVPWAIRDASAASPRALVAPHISGCCRRRSASSSGDTRWRG